MKTLSEKRLIRIRFLMLMTLRQSEPRTKKGKKRRLKIVNK